MIPQEFTTSSNIKIDFTDKYGENHSLSYTLNGNSWAKGNLVSYTVNATNISYKYLYNPLWYMAETNVKAYNSSTKVVTLESNSTSIGSGSCWNWATAMTYFSATHNTTQYDGYKIGDIKDSKGSVFTYHLPTSREFASIVGFINETDIFKESSVPKATILNDGTNNKCRFGYSNSTRNSDVTDISYWSSYSTNLRYAIRYLGTDYCSVWKYQLNTTTGVLTISAKLIDKIGTTETTKMAATMSTISSASAAYWNENVLAGSIQRNMYMAGYYRNGGAGGNGVAETSIGTIAYYWDTTDTFNGGRSCPHYLGFFSEKLYIRVTDGGTQWGYPIRLFRVVQ